jgi:hypothetical protein
MPQNVLKMFHVKHFDIGACSKTGCCHRRLQFFGPESAKRRIFKESVPKTEVLEQTH